MRTQKLSPILFLLIAVTALALLAGCSAATSTPTLTPIPRSPTHTRTPRPPTSTPVPAATLTPIPTVSPTAQPTQFGGGSGMVYAFCTTGLYGMPAVGGTTIEQVKLPVEAGAVTRFDWSPKGDKLVLESGGNLYLVNMDGSAPLQLTQKADSNFYPRFSPDGSKIVYSAKIGTALDLTVMNADGTGQKALTTGISNARFPVWSPDGSMIYFADGPNKATISVIPASGGDKKMLTEQTSVAGIQGVSPDGSQVLFEYGSSDNSRLMSLVVASGKINDLTPMTDSSGGQWSADGKKIYFSSKSGGRPNIYAMDADGKNITQITTNNLGTDTDPVLSPDRSMIAFFRERDINKRGIFMINTDGTGFTPLLFPQGCNVPSWQP
jgi:Tol biopolymer transport system component